MKVCHRIKIKSICPVNGDADHYTAYCYTSGLLYCEKIVAARDDLTTKPVTQEVLTQALADRLGCKVRTVGTHCQGQVKSVVICFPAKAVS